MIRKLKDELMLSRSARQIAKLYSDEPTLEDQGDIARWNLEDEEFKDNYVRMNHLISDLEVLSRDEELMSLVEGSNLDQKFICRPIGITNWPKIAMAASLILALFLPLMIILPDEKSGTKGDRYVTRVGEQKKVVLKDGSSVVLNTNSEMIVSYNDSKRSVFFERGEGYFDVSKDYHRPFFVNTGERKIVVLGTEFNLYRTPDRLSLLVVEGEVAIGNINQGVESPVGLQLPGEGSVNLEMARQYRIVAGEGVTFDPLSNTLTAHKISDLNRVSSWRSGVIRFSEEPLENVVHELNRYSAKKILIDDPSISNVKLFATVRIDRIDEALRVLELSLPIKLFSYGDRIIIRGK